MGWPGPTTNRQHEVWVRWLRDEWNRPSRSDHYLMRVAQAVAGGKAKLTDFLVPFTFEKPAAAMTKDELRRAKMRASVNAKLSWGMPLSDEEAQLFEEDRGDRAGG